MTLLGGLAWLAGQPFVFPSLGPSAFILAHQRTGPATRPRRVVGSHVIGVGAGLLATVFLADGVTLTTLPPPGSLAGLSLAASAGLSMLGTVAGMLATDTVHAPACATTLIVSLGLLATPFEAGLIVVSVVLLVGAHRAGLVLMGERAAGGERTSGP
ncbi:MAG: HPP family protein [Halanaeroarchaeum sp.]